MQYYRLKPDVVIKIPDDQSGILVFSEYAGVASRYDFQLIPLFNTLQDRPCVSDSSLEEMLATLPERDGKEVKASLFSNHVIEKVVVSEAG